MNLLIHAPLPDAEIQTVRDLAPDLNLVFAPPDEPLSKELLRDTEILYASGTEFEPQEAPRLRWVQLNTAAANQVVDKPLARSGVPICTVKGAYSVAVAECAIAMLLALTRRIPQACGAQIEHQWRDEALQGEDVCGKAMGIIGYGSIGRQIARIASAMGMKILACKRDPEQREYSGYALPNSGDPDGALPDAWFGIEEINEVLRQSDVAMVTLPLTPKTKGLIGKRELDALPPSAYFLNVGRGSVVDETALLDALNNKRLAGAALDVFVTEPLPDDSPVWDTPNLLVMPHVGSWTTMQATRAAGVLIENLKRDLAGQPLLNVVDMQHMY